MDERAFDTLAVNVSKYEIAFENYWFASQEEGVNLSDAKAQSSKEFLVHKRHFPVIVEPRICTWDYLPRPELTKLLQLEKSSQMRKFIEKKLKKKPKGFSRIILRELMHTVLKYCKKSNFGIEQTGAVLSQFYLTHLLFTGSLDVGAEKLYDYFKNLQLCHSAPFPPSRIKLFNLEEIKNIMIYFCKLYLRNLPIIRFMSLPNFTLRANFNIEPDEFIGKKKGKGKKGKGEKGKKKKK
ncbi:hypothetical protein Zmor_006888 [Zophobas morio]|uniref:Uncharacterized protein n=1 Tax=Zophobas morio TaxID=2755281 RepID=A0AA38MNQ4_9CUCU|nr:hypothetical protein Zmor_006888 [Zophobas morio]